MRDSPIYNPRSFEVADREKCFELIRSYPFATVISGAEISHLPLLLDGNKLVGHMAKRNPLWRSFDGGEATVIFHGPHTYITPKWYAENDVPTWNYAVVHVRGRTRAIEGHAELVQILHKITAQFEGGDDPWKFYIPEDLADESTLTSAIVGFEIEIESLVGKFKLSQNRSPADQNGVIEGLKSRTDEMSAKILSMMIENLSRDRF